MDLVIIGNGGHGRVVYDIAKQSNNYKNIFFLDDNSNNSFVEGKCSDFIKFANCEFYIAFGDNDLRLYWLNILKSNNMKLATIIHKTAYVSETSFIGEGTVILPYAIVNTNVNISKCCIVNVGSIIDHDCTISNGCHIGPGAIVKANNHLSKGLKIEAGEVIPINYYKKEKLL